MAAIAFGKMRRAGEPAGQGHVDHAHVGLHQQVARFLQPQLHVVPLGRAVQIPTEQPLKLAGRHAYFLGQIGGRHRVFDIAFHHLDDLGQLWMPNADPGRDRQALRVLISADRRIDHLIGHGIGQILAMIRRDHLQHQVDG